VSLICSSTLVVAKKMKFGFLRWGKLQSVFDPRETDISGKEVFWNFESMTIFALLIEIYPP
jgi:hypothetical protein